MPAYDFSLYLAAANEKFHQTIGLPLIFLIIATGIYLTVKLNFLQVNYFLMVLRETFGRVFISCDREIGDITPFQALTTALAATFGTGNIAGVATAISLGGPGAIFWMWVSAFFGMVTKYGEVVLAVRYREHKENGEVSGGPMYYLERGLRQRFFASIFAFFGALAAFGIGNMVQSNSAADAVESTFGIPSLVTGLVLAVVAATVIVGGIYRIASFTEKMIPLMAFFYFSAALLVLFIYRDGILPALALIISSAFTGRAAVGGFVGAGVWHAFRFGIVRGIFTNEAGLGSASIAHAAARTDHPARQGMWGIMEVFIDTHVVCTMTALALLVTGAWTLTLDGAAMTAEAFNRALPGVGGYIVSLGLVFFAFSTVIAWSYYGEKCLQYLTGDRFLSIYRSIWIVFIVVGAVGGLHLIWGLADTLNTLMAVPNLIGLLGLSGTIFKLTAEFFWRTR